MKKITSLLLLLTFTLSSVHAGGGRRITDDNGNPLPTLGYKPYPEEIEDDLRRAESSKKYWEKKRKEADEENEMKKDKAMKKERHLAWLERDKQNKEKGLKEQLKNGEKIIEKQLTMLTPEGRQEYDKWLSIEESRHPEPSSDMDFELRAQSQIASLKAKEDTILTIMHGDQCRKQGLVSGSAVGAAAGLIVGMALAAAFFTLNANVSTLIGLD